VTIGEDKKEIPAPVPKQIVSKPVQKKVDTTVVEKAKARPVRKRYKRPVSKEPTEPVVQIVPPPYPRWPNLVLGRKASNPHFLIESLKGQYNSQDVLMILSGELHKGNFIVAWQAYKALESIAGSRSKEKNTIPIPLSICRRQMESFFKNNTLEDREFFLVKAHMYYTKKDYRTAMTMLQKGMAVPSGNTNDAIARTTVYYHALASWQVYKADMTESHKTATHDSWVQVKKYFAPVRDRRYVLAAESQLAQLDDVLNQ
jgi:hypothetical protein